MSRCFVPFVGGSVVVIPREPHALADGLRWPHVGLVHLKFIADDLGQNILTLRGQTDARFFYFFAVWFFVPTHNKKQYLESGAPMQPILFFRCTKKIFSPAKLVFMRESRVFFMVGEHPIDFFY